MTFFTKSFQVSLGIFVVFTIVMPAYVNAQTSLSSLTGVASPIQVSEKVEDGDIISTTKAGYKKSVIFHDPAMYGVITDNPAVVLKKVEDDSVSYAVTEGQVKVKVTSANGNIAKNDLITTSTTPGVGVKAVQNGMVLGLALEAYSSNDKKAVGKISISVKPYYTTTLADGGGNLLELLRIAGSSTEQAPIAALRYILSATIAIVSFVLGFIYFGRVASKGVESLGRNPLAGKLIEMGVVINVALTIVIILVGMAISYLILII